MPGDSDSDEDPDYIPPDADSGISDIDEPEAKRPRISGPLIILQEEEETKKKAREQLWTEFLASTPPSATRPEHATHKLVKIEKRYRFAGKDVVELEEVPDDSEDAKTWPRWISPDNGTPNETRPHTSTEPPSVPSTFTSSDSRTASIVNKSKRPGPRKSKTSLPPLPTTSSQKTKKLTTLDKSAIDWRAHLNSSQDFDLKDQLEANRRGGGYLDKVEFLQRVEERKNEVLDANKSTKRRR